MVSFRKDFGINIYDILAISKPWQNNFTLIIYYLLKNTFELYCPDLDNFKEKTGICFFVNKYLKPQDIEVSFHLEDFTILIKTLF